MNIKKNIQEALDKIKDGILNITKEMQSTESVKTIHVRKDSKYGSTQTIIINGKYTFTSDDCLSINIEGDVHSVDTQGRVECHNVTGNVDTQGRVECGDVGGKVNTQGRVTCRDIQGNINTMGKVEAHDVKGNISTMGKVVVNSRG